MNHMLRILATHLVGPKADELICNFEQTSLTPYDFSQTLPDLKLRCRCLYDKQTLQQSLNESIQRSVRSTIRHCQVYNL